MLPRPGVTSTSRPPLPTRSVTIGQHIPHTQQLRRPTLPSRLSSVRSASASEQHVGLDNHDVGPQTEAPLRESLEVNAINHGDRDTEEGRVRKKPKIKTEEVMVPSPEAELDSSKEDASDEAHTTISGNQLPLPPRLAAAPRRSTNRKQLNHDPLRKADGLHPPPIATRLPPPNGIADFNPWSGTQPEDVLSDTIVKGGYYDKPSNAIQNEINSARPSIWPNLSQKNNVALHTLSHIFLQVLDKRAAMGRITAPSSFKPPPRVTVTDTKREAWLKDLANLSIPLRRQSRTIPHGIRGKGLMDQCLGKAVPLSRAIWLAKCVGANELRAFRRKGVSGPAGTQGESKWLRDWTLSVQQFFESVVQECGNEGWRKRIDYAIKLTTALFTEGLVERDEYLDWIVRMFATAEEKSLPLWIIVVQIYWRELVKFGTRGRRLAGAVLQHLHLLMSNTTSAYNPLKERLRKLVAILAVTERGCLILPAVWEKYQDLLIPVESALPAHQRAVVEHVRLRNERLAAPMSRTAGNTRSPALRLYDLLDNIGLNVVVEMLTRQCLAHVPETNALVSALLRWASSEFRVGDTRTHITAGIIMQLHEAGYETDGAILAFLQNETAVTSNETKYVCAVVAQLAGRECFAVGRYLQWLITNGIATASGRPTLATSLLAALPVESVPRHLRSLRDTLLDRSGWGTDETAAVDNVVKGIEEGLRAGHLEYSDSKRALLVLTPSAQRTVANTLVRKATLESKQTGITNSAFCILRDVLEQTNNLTFLADLISSAARTEDLSALASAAGTVSTHVLSFAVLGVLTPLFDSLHAQHLHLRSHAPPDRTFLLALRSLAARLGIARAHVVEFINNDLVLYDQQSSAAACSPASDNLINMSAGRLESDEQIEAVFQSGNVMDEGTMRRVFGRVVQIAEVAIADAVLPQSRLCVWLNQLRGLDAAELERLARQYVLASLSAAEPGLKPAVGVVAVHASGCLALEDVLPEIIASATPGTAATVLALLAAPLQAAALTPPERYTFTLQRRQFCGDHRDEIAVLLRRAVEDESLSTESDWLIELSLRTFSNSTTTLPPTRLSDAVLRHLSPTPPDLSSLIPSANALNLPFTLASLQSRLPSGPPQAPIDALLEAFRQDTDVWPQLLSAASASTLKTLHEFAVDQVLLAATTTELEVRKEGRARMRERCCELMGLTFPAVQSEDSTQVLVAVTEKLKTLATALEISVDAHMITALHTLLHVCGLYSASALPSPAVPTPRLSLTTTLLNLLALPTLQRDPATSAYMHDTASLYTDTSSLSDLDLTARTLLPTAAKVPYLSSLLPDPSPQNANLALASRTRPARQPVLPRVPAPRARNNLPGQAPQVSQGAPIPLPGAGTGAGAGETKYQPFVVKRWEVLPDASPVVGENDCAIGLGVFGGRKV